MGNMALTKKQKKNWIIVGVVFLVIILGVILFNFVDFNGQALAITNLDTNVGQCSGGFTSFSIDRVTINSDKSRIRVFGVAKGSECLSINLDANELNQELSGEGVQATRNVFGQVRLREYTKTFPIDRQKDGFGKDIFYKSVQTGTFSSLRTFDLCNTNNCKKNIDSNSVGSFQTGFLGDTCNCIYPGGQGIAGDFSAARSFGNFEVDFTIDGQTRTLTREQQAVSIGNHRIEWVGNLLNLDEIFPPQFDARLLISKWGLVRDGALDGVDREFDKFEDCFRTGFNAFTQPRFNTCKSTFDLNVNSILSEKISLYKSQNSALIFDADTDQNNLFVTLKASPYPAFILDLDASDVGIIALEGEPEITQCIPNQLDLRSGENRNVNFRVRNNANVDNVEFFGGITCNQGAVGFFPNFNIGANQEKIITAELNPSNPNQADLSGNCQLRVNDLKSGNSDTCGFSIKVEYESGIICSPNSLTCDGEFKNLLRCTSDGKNQVVEQECEFGCEITSTGAKCRGQLPPPTVTNKCESCDAWAVSKVFNLFGETDNEFISDRQCEPKTFLGIDTQRPSTCVFSIVKFALVPLVFIFTLLFSFNFFQTSSFGRINNKGLAFLVSLIIALILATFIFFTFIIGIILFIILVIAWSILKSVIPKGSRKKIESGITKCKEGFKRVGNACVKK